LRDANNMATRIVSTSVTGVATALPAFIGSTSRAQQDGRDVTLTPIVVSSLAEFEATFGGATSARPFDLEDGLRLFYGNGGGSCYIVSVGAGTNGVAAADLVAGLDVIERHTGPTMLVVPEALLLPAAADFSVVVRKMLDQCGRLGDRVAILDVFGADTLTPDGGGDLDALIAQFHDAVGDAHLSYGAAYFPCLYTEIDQPGTSAGRRRVVPASGAIAGVYASVDATRGVWTAPANVSIAGIVGPTFPITDAQQEPLNVPLDGKAVNAIRAFGPRGTLVWGARTLAGNDQDRRYIHVRRTLIYIEQSIKQVLGTYALAPNNAQTWTAVVSLIASFLTTLWQQGGLVGATAADAFSVACGLGSTMTADDILDGQLRVAVTVQIVHPAEFIVLTIVQEMQGG
jgi:phage tail sheath protein FI